MSNKEKFRYGVFERNTGEVVYLSNDFRDTWYKLYEFNEEFSNYNYDFIDLLDFYKYIREIYLNSLGVYMPNKKNDNNDTYVNELNKYIKFVHMYDNDLI